MQLKFVYGNTIGKSSGTIIKKMSGYFFFVVVDGDKFLGSIALLFVVELCLIK